MACRWNPRRRLTRRWATTITLTKPLGLGVGLAICRRLIEAQGGTLRAAQNPAGGALFEFTLPVAPAESA